MFRALVLLAVVFTGMVWIVAAQEPRTTVPPGALPGAQAEIDAGKFPSLQAAFDAIPAEGGVVRIAPGTFEISQPLILSRGDVLIEGSGTATHIKNINAEGRPALVVKHPDGENVKPGDQLWRVMLSQFRITGQERSGNGIEAVMVNEVFLQGVTVSYHGGDGIKLDRCYEDARVNACLITYNKQTGLNIPAATTSSCQGTSLKRTATPFTASTRSTCA